MRILSTVSMALAFGLLIAVPAVAQESPGTEDRRVLTSAAVDDALAGHASAGGQQRAELARLLSMPLVQELAHDRGIDMGRVESAAAGLSDQQMEEIAPLLAKATPLAQDGLGTVTISVVGIIILLLILILIS
jgi:hypothetical protein